MKNPFRKINLFVLLIALVTSSASAQNASWIGQSYIVAAKDGGTLEWFNASGNGQPNGFNDYNFGTISSLKLTAQVKTSQDNADTYPAQIGYKFDDDGTVVYTNLAWIGWNGSNNVFGYEPGDISGWNSPNPSYPGAESQVMDINLSGLTPGQHTISVWFRAPSDGNDNYQWDSNNSNNYKAKFTIVGTVTIPTAVTGLVYDGTEQTSLVAGTGYTLTGNTATGAGSHTATATLDEYYKWSDGTTDPKNIVWSIAPRPITISAADASKATGSNDPEFSASITSGSVADNQTINISCAREVGETAGTYAITPSATIDASGVNVTANYAITAEPGTLTIFTASGNCGKTGSDNVTWALTDTDGDGSYETLTISGTGDMADYEGADFQPWADKRSGITTIVIEDGVTSIGNYAFSNCEYVTSAVTIPASVESIGYYSFNYCFMPSLSFAANSALKTIDGFAFNCSRLTSITIPASVTSIGGYAFDSSSNLATVTLNSNPAIGTDAFGSAAVTMNLTANAAGGAKWMTFYNQNYNFQADENTQVFKVELSNKGGLTLHEVEDKIVNVGTAVVLKTTGEGNPDPVMTKTTEVSSNDSQANSLQGVNDAAGTVNDGTFYVLNNGSQGVGFYKLASGKTVGVGKAYLTYNGVIGGAREFFLFDEATAIDMPKVESNDADAVVYDLQGRRVQNPTKGLYIVNGKKVIIK